MIERRLSLRRERERERESSLVRCVSKTHGGAFPVRPVIQDCRMASFGIWWSAPRPISIVRLTLLYIFPVATTEAHNPIPPPSVYLFCTPIQQLANSPFVRQQPKRQHLPPEISSRNWRLLPAEWRCSEPFRYEYGSPRSH